MNRRITARGIIYKDGKIFAQRLKRGAGETDFWCTPGGGLDDGEGLCAGLIREMIEETGVAPEVGVLLYVQQYRDENGLEFLEFFYHITNADDYDVSLDLERTSHGVLEVARCGFIDPRIEHILPDFLQETDIAADIQAGIVQEFSYL